MSQDFLGNLRFVRQQLLAGKSVSFDIGFDFGSLVVRIEGDDRLYGLQDVDIDGVYPHIPLERVGRPSVSFRDAGTFRLPAYANNQAALDAVVEYIKREGEMDWSLRIPIVNMVEMKTFAYIAEPPTWEINGIKTHSDVPLFRDGKIIHPLLIQDDLRDVMAVWVSHRLGEVNVIVYQG